MSLQHLSYLFLECKNFSLYSSASLFASYEGFLIDTLHFISYKLFLINYNFHFIFYSSSKWVS